MRALIVGASRGIGHEFVRQYLGDGWAVTGTARDDSALAALRELGATVATGRFRTDMQVELVNDGPVTLLLEL